MKQFLTTYSFDFVYNSSIIWRNELRTFQLRMKSAGVVRHTYIHVCGPGNGVLVEKNLEPPQHHKGEPQH